ncbi:Gamma-glutamyltranspeptidase [Macleaya cordata]|uniref:Gamma-glutamyltranspeptidase n=1 Tax=Macleaya cordata TaxID=56857 RepID=A0A200QVI2_MACCD|nr:Gamma-glutamyltranspeptidase [Macleaya cordata]
MLLEADLLTLSCLDSIVVESAVDGGPVFRRLSEEKYKSEKTKDGNEFIVESRHGVVAADDGRCSKVGVVILRKGGHAVDAAVATTLCLGVVNPMSSGIGGGGFMIVRSLSTSQTEAFDSRETTPLAASQDMYAKNLTAKSIGALSISVPGEIAGLHEAWLKHGRLAWSKLFEPAIRLAKDGFLIAPYLANAIKVSEQKIMADPGLREVFAPKGKLLQAGDTCYNIELTHTLMAVANHGPQAFYNWSFGEKIVKDVRDAGGILTMEDMRNYRVEVMDAMAVDAMGYTILGMPPPSSATLGLSQDNRLAGVIGGSGGLSISPAVIQVFLNQFIIGMEPLAAVEHPRVYHQLIPNVVLYENWTIINGDHIELLEENKSFLRERGHELKGQANRAICQLVVQTLQTPIKKGRKIINGDHHEVFHGMLTAE